MVLVADGGGGGQVLSFEPDQIKVIVGYLQQTAADLEESRAALGAVNASAFGGSWMGGFVREHSEKAYLAVCEALSDNTAALKRYEDALIGLDKDVQTADDNGAGAITTTAHRLDQVDHNLDLGTGCSAAGAGDQNASCAP